MRQSINCESCGFSGTLSYRNTEFGKADICYCPACGGDILQEYADDDLEADFDIQDAS